MTKYATLVQNEYQVIGLRVRKPVPATHPDYYRTILWFNEYNYDSNSIMMSLDSIGNAKLEKRLDINQLNKLAENIPCSEKAFYVSAKDGKLIAEFVKSIKKIKELPPSWIRR